MICCQICKKGLFMAVATVISAVGAYLVGRVADQGLANFFGEATCRHGTHPLAWLSIHITGALPQMGGNSTGGSDKHIADYNKGLFFYARGAKQLTDSIYARWITSRLIPRQFCFQSTHNLLNKFMPSLFSIPLALFTAVVLPPIRIRMAQEDLEKMPNAPLMPCVAVCTDKWISPLNFGTPGTIWNALHYKTLPRMLREPMRVITGIGQLAIAGAAAYFVFTKMPNYITIHRTSLVAGAVLGMI